MKCQIINNSIHKENHDEIASVIAPLLRDIRFCSIEIVIHEGRIAHIDKRERFRPSDIKNTK